MIGVEFDPFFIFNTMNILNFFLFVNFVSLIFYYLLDARSRKEFGISVVLIIFFWTLIISLICTIYENSFGANSFEANLFPLKFDLLRHFYLSDVW